MKSEMVGEDLHRQFVKERIVGHTGVWEKMSKAKLLCWKDASNTVKEFVHQKK